MAGGKRSVPCAYDRYVLSLYPTGDVLPCAREDWIHFGSVLDSPVDEIWFGKSAKDVRRRMKKEVCPSCDFYCGAEYTLKKEFFTYLRYFLKATLSRRPKKSNPISPS
jgi:radical SAM protein with 4Fe4S-binding SPASM domain